MNQDLQENFTNTSNFNEHLVCWKSAFAGLAIAAITFTGATGLALALGGAGLSDGSSGTAAGVFSGVSFVIAIVISTLVGAYFAVRVRGRGGRTSSYTQSLLVGSLVILLVLIQAGMAIGAAGKAASGVLGSTILAAGSGATAVSQSPMLQDIVEDNLGTMNLRSAPEVVLRGVTSRLMNSNEEGAKNYLAAQAGLTPAEADAKIATAKAKIDQAIVETREAAATAMQATGWSLFTVVVLGLLASLLGGYLAAKFGLHTYDNPQLGRKSGTLAKVS